jgi:hypothetical protein
MDDEHRSPYVVIVWKQWKQCHNYNHFGLLNAYFTKFYLPNLFMEWIYNTSFHVIILSMYYWIMV